MDQALDSTNLNAEKNSCVRDEMNLLYLDALPIFA
jgi:hypothetical protein